MDETKHTPGPWSYDGEYIGTADAALFEVVDQTETAESNAILAACAPEMLEWIKINRIQHREGIECAPGICSSCDLIRKAEGRAPFLPAETKP